jgi:hypothetical protein
MPDVEFLCLANSRKLQGRCVAGLRLDGGGWIRPVSGSLEGTLYSADYTHDRGAECALLDVLRVPVTEPRPDPHQPENWVIGPGQWRLAGRLTFDEALPYLGAARVAGPTLLGNVGDRVPYAPLEREPAAASLAIVEPEALEWRIATGARGNRQTRARFRLGRASYDLSITDPVLERRLAHLPVGVHPRVAAGISDRSRAFLTVSLGEPFHGDCYKLVAAVVAPASNPRGTALRTNAT